MAPPLPSEAGAVYHGFMRAEEIHARLHNYSRAEELANCFTHGLGVLLSIFGGVALIGLAAGQNDQNRFFAACVYGIAVVVFYSLSTAYHSVRKPYARYIFRILDHIAIYIMIAGSYTPFALVTLRGLVGKVLFGTVWGLGAVGAILKIFTVHRMRVAGPIIYLGMGWLALVVLKPLMAAMPATALLFFFLGGAAYTIGVIFYLWDRLPFNHAIWHLFVLTGSACHFWAIFHYVTPLHL
ncbi:hemolysin III [Geomonas sp. Red276]